MKIDIFPQQSAHLPGAMNKLIAGLALVSITMMTPFTVNNFLQGRVLLGLGSGLIVFIFFLNAWSLYRRERYYPVLILIGLVPAILFFLFLSISQQGIIGVLWSYPALISFYFMLPGRLAWLANAALLSILVPSAWSFFDAGLAARITATIVMVSVFSALFLSVITEQHKRLQRLAVTDPLTGTLNRASLRESLDQAVQQNARAGLPMSLIAFDLDHFKNINDELGHDAGDAVLKDTADLLQKRCRSVDNVFRLGGEEFLVLLYNTDLNAALAVADELRDSIARLQTLPGRSVTTSVGVASLRSGESWSSWIKRSDENLYRAKMAGRNRVTA